MQELERDPHIQTRYDRGIKRGYLRRKVEETSRPIRLIRVVLDPVRLGHLNIHGEQALF